MAFKLITFDFTGTLMRFRLPPPVQYEKVAQRYGINIKNKEEFKGKFKTAFQTVNKEHPNFGSRTNLPWTEWWLRVVKLTFMNAGVEDSPTLNNLAIHLIQIYGSIQGWEVVPGVETLLQNLQKKGQRMGVISNIDPRIENILKEAGLRHHFEFVLPSYEVDCFKPDPQIFKIALEKYSAQVTNPSDCCHVGDSFNEDYLGAINSGWNAMLINEVSPNHSGISHFKNIHELNEKSVL